MGENMTIFLVTDFSLFDRLGRQKCQNYWKIVKIDHIIRNFFQTMLILGIIHCLRDSSVYGWYMVKIWRYSLWPIFLYLIDCDAKNAKIGEKWSKLVGGSDSLIAGRWSGGFVSQTHAKRKTIATLTHIIPRGTVVPKPFKTVYQGQIWSKNGF